MESWLAPEPTKVMLSECVRPGNDTSMNNSWSLNVGPAEAAPIGTSVLGAAKVEPAVSIQNKTALQTGMLHYFYVQVWGYLALEMSSFLSCSDRVCVVTEWKHNARLSQCEVDIFYFGYIHLFMLFSYHPESTSCSADSSPQQPRSGASASAEIKKSTISGKSGATNTKGPVRVGKKLKKPASTSTTNLPALSELDPSVLASLPPEILLEIQEAYGELPAHPVVSSKSAPESLPKAANIVNPLEPVQSEETSREGSSGASLVETRSLRGESSRPASVNPEIVALPPASQVMQ